MWVRGEAWRQCALRGFEMGRSRFSLVAAANHRGEMRGSGEGVLRAGLAVKIDLTIWHRRGEVCLNRV
jgi:hypothetical protein